MKQSERDLYVTAHPALFGYLWKRGNIYRHALFGGGRYTFYFDTVRGSPPGTNKDGELVQHFKWKPGPKQSHPRFKRYSGKGPYA